MIKSTSRHAIYNSVSLALHSAARCTTMRPALGAAWMVLVLDQDRGALCVRRPQTGESVIAALALAKDARQVDIGQGQRRLDTANSQMQVRGPMCMTRIKSKLPGSAR
jgi:hypothetical protein